MKVRGQEARKKRKTLYGSRHMSVSLCHQPPQIFSLASGQLMGFGSSWHLRHLQRRGLAPLE